LKRNSASKASLQLGGGALQVSGRISIHDVIVAAKKVRRMTQAQKLRLADEIYEAQPNLLAACLCQQQLGVAPESVEFLLHLLFTCFEAMKESPFDWPIISEAEQERQLQRLVGSVKFSEELDDPALANAAREQYVADHPEQPLLAFVLGEVRPWLQDLTHRGAGAESDKYVMMAAINMVNCIAHASARPRRPR
jgi:hypothetical protein